MKNRAPRFVNEGSKINIAYQLLGTSEFEIYHLKKRHNDRLKQIEHLKPMAISKIIEKERLDL